MLHFPAWLVALAVWFKGVTVRALTKGRAYSWLGTLGFLRWFFLVVRRFSFVLHGISESDVLKRCSYHNTLTVDQKDALSALVNTLIHLGWAVRA